MDKTTKTLVKGVLSGDTLLLSGKIPKNGDGIPEEHTLNLTGIQSPHPSNPSKSSTEEPYAYESRTYLRRLLAGKVCVYKTDYAVNDRSYGQVFINKQNVAVELVKQGYAKVTYVPKGNESIYNSSYWNELKQAEEHAKKSKLNIWNTTSTKAKRALVNISDSTYDINAIKQAIKTKKELTAVIEHVFNCSFFAVYIVDLNVYAKMNLRFIAIPNMRDELLVKTGKNFVERIALHQDVKIVIHNVDDMKNIIGDIKCSRGSLAGQILKEGYSKIFIGNNTPCTTEELNEMKAYQQDAKLNRLRIWVNEPQNDNSANTIKLSSSNDNDNNNKDYDNVKCLQVHSGDSITIINPTNNEQTRIFLSNIKAPSLAKANSLDNDQPWAFQSKEYLRKILIGKTITCIYDYSKSPKESTSRKMNFYTVYLDSTCINALLVEKGFAFFSSFKIEEGNPSKELNTIRSAELTAKEKKINIHSPKTPPIPSYSDLISANKNKKKEFISLLTNLHKQECVVEHCFSGHKLKLRIESKQCMIPLSMVGIKTFTKDKNNTDLHNMFYQKALDYTMNAVLQRNGTCDVVNADRIGNYFGHFIYDNKNFAFELLSKGLAVVSENENNPNPYYHEMLKYEAAAQEKKVGIWQYDNLGNILKYGEGSSLSFDYEEVHKDMTSFRINEYIDFHNFYINVLPNNTLNTIEKVLSEYDNTPSKCVKLELPIKMGTLCACKYSEDNKYYRAIVKAVTKDKKYEVEFIDYGNVEVAPIDSLIKLDGSVTTYEPQALLCEMAYLKYSKNSMRKALEKFENFADFDKVVKGKMCYKYNEDGKAKCGVVVYLKGDNVDTSYHSEFLRLGYAKMDRTKKVPTYLKALDDVERKAKEKGMGLWHENERCDYGIDEEEEEYGY